MALSKGEQSRLRDLLKEAVLMLCKGRLSYETKFRIEGLLGITVDDKDVTLVSIMEDVMKEKEENLQICEVYQLSPMKTEEEAEQEEEEEVNSREYSGCEENSAVLQTPVENSVVVNTTKKRKQRRKRKPVRALIEEEDVESSDPALEENTDGSDKSDGNRNGDKKGFFSPTVDQIIQEYEQQQYVDSASLTYMAKRKRRKYPNLTELHTQGLLPIPTHPPATMVSILPRSTTSDVSTKVIIRRTEEKGAPTIVIKNEPTDSDSPDSSVLGTVTPITIEPKACLQNNSKSLAYRDTSVASPSPALRGSNVSTHWIEESILKQVGCFVSTRVMLRRHSCLRGETVVSVMNAMSRSRASKNYLGEFKQQGRIQVFYKCPPVLLNPAALEPFRLSLDEYSNYFFANPKPHNGTPSQWLSYVNTVMEGVPYNPHLFPVESFQFEGEELDKLNTKRQVLEQRYAESADNDAGLLFGTFKDEYS